MEQKRNIIGMSRWPKESDAKYVKWIFFFLIGVFFASAIIKHYKLF